MIAFNIFLYEFRCIKNVLQNRTKCTSCHGNCFVFDHSVLRPPRIARPGTVIVNRLVSSTAEFGHLHQLVKISIRENKYWKWHKITNDQQFIAFTQQTLWLNHRPGLMSYRGELPSMLLILRFVPGRRLEGTRPQNRGRN